MIGAAGLGNAIGPLIGGVLTDALSWRWIFFLNVPISIFAVLVTYFLVHVKEPEAGEQRIDYAGIAALSVGLVSLLVALDQVDDWGWGDPKVIGLLALAAVLVVAFVPIERRAGAEALVPREVMRNESFSASCLAILFMSATFFAALLYLPQFMQKQLGYSPLEAGVGMLPFLGTFAARLLRRRPALQPARGEAAGRLRRRLHHDRPVPLLAGRRRLRLRLAGRRHGRARDRDRQLLPDRDHGRRHLGRRIADQPRRRHRLHVPDRRRLDRPGPDDDGLLGPRSALRRRHPGRLPPRRGALPGRLPGRPLLRRRPAAHAAAGGRASPPSGRAAAADDVSSPGPPRVRVSTPGPPRSTSLPGPPNSDVVAVAAEEDVVAVARRPACRRRRRRTACRAGAAEQEVAPGAAAHRHRDRDVAGDPDPVVTAVGVDFEAGDRGAWQTSSFGFPGVFADVPPTSSGTIESIT